jgi:hypothetical protein
MAARTERLGGEALTAAAAIAGCRAVDTSAVAADREERLEDETILAEEGSSQAAARSRSIQNAAEEPRLDPMRFAARNSAAPT